MSAMSLMSSATAATAASTETKEPNASKKRRRLCGTYTHNQASSVDEFDRIREKGIRSITGIWIQAGNIESLGTYWRSTRGAAQAGKTKQRRQGTRKKEYFPDRGGGAYGT